MQNWIPACAGMTTPSQTAIRMPPSQAAKQNWIPAFAGMTALQHHFHRIAGLNGFYKLYSNKIQFICTTSSGKYGIKRL